uniref:Phosphatidylinositol 4-phosphate 3-kinase C2 domain-containing subunit alpha-like n=1 Tax=Phallusia mammillata TaxID=59560 RepID=A0A6F9DN70_9ASCI|nr:phosphatidylinositol 4-phosphate 3-kinase C2 domain-containing subunit alpha-like [Phallusia mammillata]
MVSADEYFKKNMADLKTAIRMEEEALKKMKRNQMISESREHGISNPLCSNDIPSFRRSSQDFQKPKSDIPDLMSFDNTVSNSMASTSEDWISLESPRVETDTNSNYNATIQNVLSLFDASTRANQSKGYSQPQWQHQSHQPNTVLGPNNFNPTHTMASQPHVIPGFPPANGTFPQTCTQSAFPQRTSSTMSHSSLFPPHSSTKLLLTKTHSHPSELNLFTNGKSSTMPVGFTSELTIRKGSWKSFDEQTFTKSESKFATFEEGFLPPNSRTSSVKTNNSSSASETEHMNTIFDDWFNDQLGRTDSTPSPKRETAAVHVHNWIDLDPLQKNKQGDQVAEPQQDFFSAKRGNAHKASPQEPAMKFHERDHHTFTDSLQTKHDGVATIGYITELDSFARTIETLRSKYSFKDKLSNPGHVICNLMSQNQWINENGVEVNREDTESTVRISVRADGISQPVSFECDVNASIEHIVSQALCISYEDISQVSAEDYSFKVVGRQEYLLSKTLLSTYEYVQECCKYERDVELELLHKSKMDQYLQRTEDDDEKQNMKQEFCDIIGKPTTVLTREDILILWEAFYNETDKLLNQLETEIESDVTSQVCHHQCERVIQSVRAMCSALGNIETVQITESVKNLRAAVNRPMSPPSRKSTVSVVHDLVGITTSSKVTNDKKPARYNKVNEAIEQLTTVLTEFVELYCQSFESDFFSIDPSPSAPLLLKQILSTSVKDLYSVNINSLHRVPKVWETSYEEFYAVCSLWHGDQCISHKPMETEHVKVTKGFYARLVWEKWLDFDVAVYDLPLETVLNIRVNGCSPSEEKNSPKVLAQINIPLYNQNKILKHGTKVFGMWDMTSVGSKVTGEGHVFYHCADNITNPDSIVINIDFSEEKNPDCVVKFPEIVSTVQNGSSPWKEMSSVSAETRQSLEKLLARAKLMVGPLCNLSKKEKGLLWQHRNIVGAPNQNNGFPGISLPLLLRCIPSWSPSLLHARDAYNLISLWPRTPQPEESLAMLTAAFPDGRVRSAAIRWLEGAGDMDIGSWLPQLVQALKWEQRHDSPLMKLILRRAIGSVRIAQKLFWLLHENMNDSICGRRYRVLYAALMVTCSATLKREFEKEHYFLKMIHRVAEAVKDAKDSAKSNVLQEDLTKVSARIGGHKFRVPINPAYVANGVNVKNSTYFTSNAVPVKVAFTNADPLGQEINIMYKVGDDLRQDALTMQLIRVMDRMWLSEGLDLRILTFECLPTGLNQGMIEIIPDSRTFREIQSSYGLTGAFKDRPIAEWLQKYNATGISYEKAVENFTLSCAGYCVATYVLGICDRHNDNIMLRRTGHLFHIDFARFLGHAQMFGNIKRDRAPFVLTSDMAYVINGGDRPSSQFQDFVDICCRAFNIVRKQSHILINLLSLMLNCGIPELSGKSDLKYVYDALRPNASDTEATTMFTKLIDASLSSSFTRFNFFIHNLAQMRFSGNESEEDRRTLSFAPQLRGYKEEEGLITMATVVGYQKRYCPEKYYLYCVKVTREKTSLKTVESYVFRTFDEFEELHEKLSYACQSWSLPSFPGSLIVGRSQVKQVADRRKAKLNTYLAALLKSKRNVAMHDLVYTFFHPILRDEEKEVKPNLRTPDVIGGEIKISLHYKNNALYIMIMHCKNLSHVNGSDPDPYVKTYLLPDPGHVTKKKTKVARKTLHPTYNEMMIYRLPQNEIERRQLQVTVWNCETLQENDFLGGTLIDLSGVDLSAETTTWYKLNSSF